MTMLLLLTALACAMEHRPFPQMQPARECVICLEGVSPGQITCCPGGQCVAAFHHECLAQWFAGFPEGIEPCPMCRAGMPASDDERYAEAEKRYALALQEMEVLQRDVDVLTQQHQRAQIEVEETKMQIQETAQEIHDAERDRDTAQSRLNGLKDQASDLYQLRDRLERQMSAMEHAFWGENVQLFRQTRQALRAMYDELKGEESLNHDDAKARMIASPEVLEMIADPDREEMVQSIFDELDADDEISSDSDSDFSLKDLDFVLQD